MDFSEFRFAALIFTLLSNNMSSENIDVQANALLAQAKKDFKSKQYEVAFKNYSQATEMM